MIHFIVTVSVLVKFFFSASPPPVWGACFPILRFFKLELWGARCDPLSVLYFEFLCFSYLCGFLQGYIFSFGPILIFGPGGGPWSWDLAQKWPNFELWPATLGRDIWPVRRVVPLILVFLVSMWDSTRVYFLFGPISIFGPAGGTQSEQWKRVTRKKVFQIWSCYILLEAYFDTDFRF